MKQKTEITSTISESTETQRKSAPKRHQFPATRITLRIHSQPPSVAALALSKQPDRFLGFVDTAAGLSDLRKARDLPGFAKR